MSNKEVAKKYIEFFCSGEIEKLSVLLSPDLFFSGTFFIFHSAKEYLDNLRKNPPEKCNHKIISITENEDSIAIFYEYQKPEKTLPVAQLFKIKNQKIQEVLLVFDGRVLT
ncbi:MAG: hypothetical protein D8M58_05715 [Calditrichaeota bacterium]|nr:MAG: hypothetical protein DWQ03_20790 [Calditrichota bacterium]MBL1204874.1 hypothetical protein [Calditrichota bacterium]NOG44703.1 hypothetical protein [Calditrichota bacterium]